MDAQTGLIIPIYAELTKEMFINTGPRKKKKRRRGMADDETSTAPACAICLEDFEFGDILSVMPCSHRFHVGCLAKWLAINRRCPCCRRTLPAVSREDGGAAANQGGAAGAGAEGSSRRRSSRTRQANVRLFGPEWLNGADDDDLP